MSRKHFWESEHGLDFSRAVWAFLTAISGLIHNIVAPESRWYSFTAMVLCAAILLLLEVRRFFLRAPKAPGRSDIDALDAVVETVHAIVLCLSNDKHQAAQLRMCVFVPDPKNPEQLHQLTDYIGPERRTGRNRPMSVRAGVVGLAVRDGKAQFASPKRGQETRQALIQQGFKPDEAAQMDLERRSWAAIPIGAGKGKVLAVLYADTKIDTFWGNRTDNKRKVMLAAAVAVARHIL